MFASSGNIRTFQKNPQQLLQFFHFGCQTSVDETSGTSSTVPLVVPSLLPLSDRATLFLYRLSSSSETNFSEAQGLFPFNGALCSRPPAVDVAGLLFRTWEACSSNLLYLQGSNARESIARSLKHRDRQGTHGRSPNTLGFSQKNCGYTADVLNNDHTVPESAQWSTSHIYIDP